ncbi:hypothetical protein VV01_21815 [Luteipulveratus halotolerans]|uniref:LysM domain-containing protein n=1 Tax=Luteipulveratus halotolerans TaxID=1631356 RepID=A0A0L6CDD5_9MICO|nr:hypothetical protein VV01_21815 [Luteipulveratus halotolerans]
MRVPQVRGLGHSQAAAKGLVAGAALLFVAGPVAAHAAPVTPTTVAASTAAGASAEAMPAASSEATAETTGHRVQPGDSLWSLAAEHLGSGDRYHEIVDLNQDILEGSPDRLEVGMAIRIPSAQRVVEKPAPHTVTVKAGETLSSIAKRELGSAQEYPRIAQATRGITQADGERLVDVNNIHPGWRLRVPASMVPNTAGGADQAPNPPAARSVAPERPAPGAAADSSQDLAARGARVGVSGGAASGAARLHGDAPTRTDRVDVQQEPLTDAHKQGPAAGWMLAGLTGGGAVLAGSALLALRRRRRAQFRARRPGRTIATPEASVVPVEKTVVAVGATSAPTVEQMDSLLRGLAARAADANTALPPLAAVELGKTEIVLHLSAASTLPEPWNGTEDQMHWSCSTAQDLEDPAVASDDQPAPYPLLVTVGEGDDGHVWLLNCEEIAAITLTGSSAPVQDFARYVAAELALNPWSAGVTVDCVGIAEEVGSLNPERIRYHESSAGAAAEAVADAVEMIQRADSAGVEVAKARAGKADDDVWAARLLLLNGSDDPKAIDQLLELVDQHPGKTGTAIVVSNGQAAENGTTLELAGDGRLRMPSAGLDLMAVGLTSEEARGCAALFAQSETLDDVEIPSDEQATEGWRSFTNEAGALRPQHAKPREGGDDRTDGSVLDAQDAEYVHAAATTEQDLKSLAPQVPPQLRAEIEAADPTLDEDVAAWLDDSCPLPRLSLLGPVRARAHGSAVAVAKRKPYATELLAYLATRPYGATPAQLADAFNLSDGRARTDIKMVRDWLGTNPRTGNKHLPNARESQAAKARGVGVYEVEDVLVDADLFRRLRARGESRGQEGIGDLLRALQLVEGRPFDQLRPGGWEWLADGDRIDHHLTAAVVDVAHMVTTSCLASADLVRARAAAEIATVVAPDSEIAKLDLVAVFEAEGHRAEAERILRDEVCNRSDDGGAPAELSERTETIIRNHEWLDPDRAAS